MRRRKPISMIAASFLLLFCGAAFGSKLQAVGGSVYGDKTAEIEAWKQVVQREYVAKPWKLTDHSFFTLTFADVTETEPNDICPGNTYAMGDTFHGMISPAGDVDFITFTANAGDVINIGTDADGILPTVDTVIELYESDCTTFLTSNDDGCPGLYSLISGFTAPYTGAYNLRVHGYSATYSTGNYIVIGSISAPPTSDEIEPNDTCPGQSYTLGNPFHGAINPPGDIDWVSFSGVAGDALSIGTDHEQTLPDVDTYIELYGADCTTLIDSDDDGGPGFYSALNLILPYTGDYHLMIRGYSASYSAGNYLLQGTTEPVPSNDVCSSAIDVPRCPGFTDAGTTAFATDDYSPTSGFSGGCTGYYAHGGDLVYRLTLVAGDAVHVEYTNAADASMYIVTDCADPEGSCVAGADNTFSGEMEVLDFVATTDGVYYLIIDTFSAYTPGGAFTLSISIPDVVPPVISCPTDAVIEAGAGCVATYDGPPATASDICDAAPVITHSGVVFTGVGTYPITWTATDAAGNASSCTQMVTVVDVTPPEVICSATAVCCPDDDPLTLDDGTDCDDLARYFSADDDVCALIEFSATDNCDLASVSAVIDRGCTPEPVASGDIIETECDDDECEWDDDFTFDPLSDDENQSQAILIVTAIDRAGNVAVCSLDLCQAFVDSLTHERLVATTLPPQGQFDVARIFPSRPNPFSGSSRIAYAVPGSGARVEIDVYNVTGRRIRNLVSDFQGAGLYEATWDGRNEAGEEVPAGVYFYRAKIGSVRVNNRVILMR